jgi:hypothetical protein
MLIKKHNLCHRSGKYYKIKGIGIYCVFDKHHRGIRIKKVFDVRKIVRTANRTSPARIDVNNLSIDPEEIIVPLNYCYQ